MWQFYELLKRKATNDGNIFVPQLSNFLHLGQYRIQRDEKVVN